jgi:hypothetical protein
VLLSSEHKFAGDLLSCRAMECERCGWFWTDKVKPHDDEGNNAKALIKSNAKVLRCIPMLFQASPKKSLELRRNNNDAKEKDSLLQEVVDR